MKKPKTPKTYWRVPYRATFAGTATVEARTAEEAYERVKAGDFDTHVGQSLVDWEATGPAREDK